MKKVIINGTEFMLHPGTEYSYVNTLELYIENDSVDEIVEAIGDSATIEIPDTYIGKDLILDYIRRTMDSGDIPVCETVFKKFPIEEKVKEQTEYIEMLEQAIVELAEIIGGEE